MVEKELLQWLIDGEPWVIYRTQLDLLGKNGGDAEVVAAGHMIGC